MKFIEALKLKSKLFFLFILITMGLVLVGVIGTMHVNAMKKNIDALYFGSLVPLTELNGIVHTYSGTLAKTIYKASRLEISPSETASDIENALFNIKRKWKSYDSHYKKDEELQYVQYASLEIEAANSYFLRVLKATLEGKDLSQISIKNFENIVTHVDNVVQKLINYEVNSATYERKKFLNRYNATVKQLGLALIIIIIAILIISYNVFGSIQQDHTKLELAAKKLKKINKKLENVSYTDTLTSLHNRRYFNLVYERELKQAKRDKSYITFMMLDIDYFKQYNDTYGHVEGDNALREVSSVLKEILKRPNDYVFRLGGEEFGVLLTKTNESNSARLARDICDSIRERKIKHENSKVNEFLTISIGIVCCIADESLHDEILISRSDEMLYEAKDTGRDRYVITSNVSEATIKSIDEISA
ncbi:MAG: diguanylate cyclase [Sulfurimonas sp.]